MTATVAASEQRVTRRETVQEASAGEARAAAAAAAEDADVTLTELDSLEQLTALSSLFDRVWGRDAETGPAMPVEILVATAHAGAQVTGAYRDGALLGGTATFLGRHEGGVHLHSHITGVLAGSQGGGIGWALKQHQRAWALDTETGNQITEVRWTFDPLVRRNAVFNLVKLGARPIAYHEDLYGRMPDERNRGLPTDRLVIRWELTAGRVVAAARGEFHEPRLDALRRVGAEVVLVDDGGEPRTAEVGGERLLVQVPDDIEEIRRRDPDRAARWAIALRDTLGAAVRAGYRIGGMTRDGWYVLAAQPSVTELAGT